VDCPTWQLIHWEGSFVAYTDKVLQCADCGVDFVFSASEQEFFAQKGFASAPKRCASCRAQRRASMGGSSYGNGGGNGGGGYARGPRELFDATCARCGKETQVPFRPTGARPVYCSDCFRLMRG
jgi:CxxC-x17-CxxC domain-containing protein